MTSAARCQASGFADGRKGQKPNQARKAGLEAGEAEEYPLQPPQDTRC